MEEWRTIPGTDAEVSSLGRVRIMGDMAELQTDSEGYKRLTYAPHRRERVHRLVARAFIDNPYKKPMVNHINGDKGDNRACNLEWVTAKENAEDAARKGLLKQGRPRPVIAIGDDGQCLVFPTQKEAAAVLKISSKDISKVITGKRKTAHGFAFALIA